MKALRLWAGGILTGIVISGSANAADVLCQDVSLNHMLVSDSYVSACLDAGVGNLTGNPSNDLFINGAGAGYDFIGDGGFTQSGNSGTFSLSSSLWNTYDNIAIGFKFGTGNQPDEWFVYLLNDLVSSGTWTFVNVFEKGGGLSHVNLYGSGRVELVPEPGTLTVLGFGLLALAGLGRRFKR